MKHPGCAMTEVRSEGSDNASSSDVIKKILTGVKKIAVVGLSPKEEELRLKTPLFPVLQALPLASLVFPKHEDQ